MNYPLHALPDEMRKATTAISAMSGVPVAAVASAVLSMASFAVQGHYDVQAVWDEEKFVPLSLYTITIVGSGGGKTTAFDYSTGGWNRYLGDAIDTYERDLDRWSVDHEIWEQERSTIKNDKKMPPDERRKQLMSHNMGEPPRPANPNSHFKTFTTAGLIDQLKGARPSVGFFTSEAGELFKGYSAGSNNGGEVELASQLTNLWDGNPIDKSTLSTGRTLLRGRRATACLMVQADVVKNFYNNRELSGQGIQARLLTVRIPDIERQKLDLSAAGKVKAAAHRQQIEAFNDRIYDWCSKPLPTNPDDAFRLEPDQLRFDKLDDEHPMVVWFNGAAIQRKCSTSKGVEAFYNRQLENAMRIAGVLAAFRGDKTISISTSIDALELIEFYTAQRETLDLGQGSSKHNDLMEPIEYLEGFFMDRKAKGKTTSFTMRELTNYAKGSVWRDLNPDVQVKVLNSLAMKEVLTIDDTKAGNGTVIRKYSYVG